MKNGLFFGLFFVIRMALFTESFAGNEISEKGYWIGDVREWHITDWQLADSITRFLKKENAQSVVDFGCGEGEYVRYFLQNGLKSEGYDGNPATPLLSHGLCQIQDLSEPFDLGKTFDWVVSLEVGEHLPHQFEKTFIENLRRHAKKGIILSWAMKGQGGVGHFNEQNNDYIKSIFSHFGYTNDVQAENVFRMDAACGWFKSTVMVFRIDH